MGILPDILGGAGSYTFVDHNPVQDRDHVHIFINATPQWSPAEIVKTIKGCTSHTLREEFEALNRMPSLWTRSYFCSTAGEVSSETIKRYIETQKRRP